ncbi:hypothetical protein D3C81_177270 [compost metagenome]
MAISIDQARHFSSETQKGLINCQTACFCVGELFIGFSGFLRSDQHEPPPGNKQTVTCKQF